MVGIQLQLATVETALWAAQVDIWCLTIEADETS
jgi:hypothetical protein